MLVSQITFEMFPTNARSIKHMNHNKQVSVNIISHHEIVFRRITYKGKFLVATTQSKGSSDNIFLNMIDSKICESSPDKHGWIT